MDLHLPALITAVFLLLVLGAVLWYAARVAVPLPEAPAGPPTGALAMERKIIAIVAMVAAMALLFLGYGFRESARQVSAQEQQLDTSIGRGIAKFTTLCFPCHGETGQGAWRRIRILSAWRRRSTALICVRRTRTRARRNTTSSSRPFSAVGLARRCRRG